MTVVVTIVIPMVMSVLCNELSTSVTVTLEQKYKK